MLYSSCSIIVNILLKSDNESLTKFKIVSNYSTTYITITLIIVMMIILNISIVQINIIIYYQMPYTIEHE